MITMLRLRFVPLLLLLLTAACGGGEGGESPEGGEAAAGTSATPAADRVSRMLNQQGYLVVPEIKARSDYYIEQYRSGALTREEAAERLRGEIEQWIAQHPDSAKKLEAAAAAASAPPATTPTPAPATPPAGR